MATGSVHRSSSLFEGVFPKRPAAAFQEVWQHLPAALANHAAAGAVSEPASPYRAALFFDPIIPWADRWPRSHSHLSGNLN